MNILLISGNTGKNTYTYASLSYIAGIFKKRKLNSIIWDLAEKPLPPIHPEFYGNHESHPDKLVPEFVNIITKADGLILGSPLYHGSYSGILKNALDNLNRDAFEGKPVGLVSHSANVRTSILACEYLRPVVRSLGGYALNSQIGTTDDDFKKTSKSITPSNPDTVRRMIQMVDEMERFVHLSR